MGFFPTWTQNPDGTFSTDGGMTGAPPGGTYVPAQANPDGSITQGHFDYPADCETCKAAVANQKKNTPSDKVTQQIVTQSNYGEVYTTTTTNLDGSGTSYGFGVQSTPAWSTDTSMCTLTGESPGVTSDVGGSWFGATATNSQSLSSPFSDSANSTQVCTPISPSAVSGRPGVSLGFGGF